jgi:hypothetical protein
VLAITANRLGAGYSGCPPSHQSAVISAFDNVSPCYFVKPHLQWRNFIQD